MKNLLLKLWIKAQILREDHGQDMVEYALVVGIIALGCMVLLQNASTQIQVIWGKVVTALTSAAGKIT